MEYTYDDSNRFQHVANRLIGESFTLEGMLRTPPQAKPLALPACQAMDKALVETIMYLKARADRSPPDSATEANISQLWLTASEKVALVDPTLAKALHFKGMGWLDNSMWDLAASRNMKISIQDMQLARQTLSDVLHAEESGSGSVVWERIAIFAFGVVFITILLGIAVFLPNPTDFQYTVLRIVLALAAAGIAALIPGFIEVKYKQFIRAGGAIAVFVIVYFFSPASIVSNPTTAVLAPTDPFKISVISGNRGQLKVDSFTFPVSDIKKKSEPSEFVSLLKQLPLSSLEIDNSKIFRVRDEKIISRSSGSPLDEGNSGVLVIPETILNDFDDHHIAFTFIRSKLPAN